MKDVITGPGEYRTCDGEIATINGDGMWCPKDGSLVRYWHGTVDRETDDDVPCLWSSDGRLVMGDPKLTIVGKVEQKPVKVERWVNLYYDKEYHEVSCGSIYNERRAAELVSPADRAPLIMTLPLVFNEWPDGRVEVTSGLNAATAAMTETTGQAVHGDGSKTEWDERLRTVGAAHEEAGRGREERAHREGWVNVYLNKEGRPRFGPLLYSDRGEALLNGRYAQATTTSRLLAVVRVAFNDRDGMDEEDRGDTTSTYIARFDTLNSKPLWWSDGQGWTPDVDEATEYTSRQAMQQTFTCFVTWEKA